MINISSLLGTTGFHFILGLICQNQNVWSCPLFFFQCIYILTLYLYIFNVHTLIISSSPFSVFFVVINRTPHHTRRNDIILNHFVVRWLIAYILYTLSLLNTQTLKKKVDLDLNEVICCHRFRRPLLYAQLHSSIVDISVHLYIHFFLFSKLSQKKAYHCQVTLVVICFLYEHSFLLMFIQYMMVDSIWTHWSLEQ